jgi:hypothetical protein
MNGVEEVALKIKGVCAYLKQNGCNWFTGEPQVSVIDFQQNPESPYQLVRPGIEHLYPLAVDPRQVLKWILDGSVTPKKVIMVKARFDLDMKFVGDFDFIPKDYNTKLEELADSGAECVVWYCNNSSSHSPFDTKYYLDWLRQNRPESTQRVLMLRNGISGLARHARETLSIGDYAVIIFDERTYSY